MRAVALALVVAAGTLLAGCGAVSGSAPTVNVPKVGATAAAPSAPAQPAGEQSERGNVVKKLGETAAFGPTQDNLVVKFVIDKITVGAKCTTQFAQKPEHGTFLKLDVRLETSPKMEQNSFYSVNPNDFTTVGADGVTESALSTMPTYSCINTTDQLTTQLSPGSKYRGSIILDTKNKAGALVLRPGFMSTGGWEWQYGGAA